MAYINGKEILFSAVLDGADQAEFDKVKANFIATLQIEKGDEITVPAEVTRLRPYAFYRHSDLKFVNLPEKLTHIFLYAFADTPLQEIDIPDSVTEIERYAFHNCAELMRVRMPRGIKNIYENLFKGCTACVDYDFTAFDSVPSLSNTNAFTGINAGAKIKVPSALYSEWIAATNWASYASYIYKKPSPDEVVYTPMSDSESTATVGVAVSDTHYFGVGELFTMGKRYVDYIYIYTEQDGSQTERTETYELTDTGAVDGSGNALVTLSGQLYSDTYAENGVVIIGNYFMGNTIFAKSGTYRIYQKFIDEAGDEYKTAAYVYEVK